MATIVKRFRDATRRRRVAGSAAALLFAVGGLLPLSAGVVQAHDLSATFTCSDSDASSPVLSIHLGDFGATFTNTVAASIDGTSVLATTTFLTDYSATFPGGDPTVGHSAEVVVTAGDDPDGSKGFTKTFELTVGHCQTPPSSAPSTAPSSAPSTAPSTAPSEVASTRPTGGVEAATATPRVTLPATSTGATPSGPTGAGFPITLAVLIGLALWALLFAPEQVVSRLRRRRR